MLLCGQPREMKKRGNKRSNHKLRKLTIQFQEREREREASVMFGLSQKREGLSFLSQCKQVGFNRNEKRIRT